MAHQGWRREDSQHPHPWGPIHPRDPHMPDLSLALEPAGKRKFPREEWCMVRHVRLLMCDSLVPSTVQAYCRLGPIDEYGTLTIGHGRNHLPSICGHCGQQDTVWESQASGVPLCCMSHHRPSYHSCWRGQQRDTISTIPPHLSTEKRYFARSSRPNHNPDGGEPDGPHHQWSPPTGQRHQTQWIITLCRDATRWTSSLVLPTQPLIIFKTTYPCPFGHHPSEAIACENTEMCRMPLWGHDQTAMAIKRQASQQSAHGNNTGRLCVSGSALVPDTRLHRSSERGPDKTSL